MPITNLDIEERVVEACELLNTNNKPCFAKATRKYSVHKDRVQRRFLEKALDLSNVGGYNKRLNNDEDCAFCVYIDLADETSLLICQKTLVVAVNSILQSHLSEGNDGWAVRVLVRDRSRLGKIDHWGLVGE
jgi:hypothetical protein